MATPRFIPARIDERRLRRLEQLYAAKTDSFGYEQLANEIADLKFQRERRKIFLEVAADFGFVVNTMPAPMASNPRKQLQAGEGFVRADGRRGVKWWGYTEGEVAEIIDWRC